MIGDRVQVMGIQMCIDCDKVATHIVVNRDNNRVEFYICKRHIEFYQKLGFSVREIRDTKQN